MSPSRPPHGRARHPLKQVNNPVIQILMPPTWIYLVSENIAVKTRQNKRDLKHVFELRMANGSDLFENLGKTTIPACEMFTSGFLPWFKNVACLNSLIWEHLPEIPSVRLKMTPNPWPLVQLSSAYITK